MSLSSIGGTGRPNTSESERRRLEFVRLLAGGRSFRDAATEARITPERALDLLWAQRELCYLDDQEIAA